MAVSLVITALAGVVSDLDKSRADVADREISTGNQLIAGWEVPPETRLKLFVGTSKATWPKPGKPPLIASIENDVLKLDFGYLSSGNTNNSPDAFRIQNLSNSQTNVVFVLSQEISPFFGWILLEGGPVLGPQQTKRVEMKISIPAGTPVGRHVGTLTITCNNVPTDPPMPVVLEVVN